MGSVSLPSVVVVGAVVMMVVVVVVAVVGASSESIFSTISSRALSMSSMFKMTSWVKSEK